MVKSHTLWLASIILNDISTYYDIALTFCHIRIYTGHDIIIICIISSSLQAWSIQQGVTLVQDGSDEE